MFRLLITGVLIGLLFQGLVAQSSVSTDSLQQLAEDYLEIRQAWRQHRKAVRKAALADWGFTVYPISLGRYNSFSFGVQRRLGAASSLMVRPSVGFSGPNRAYTSSLSSLTGRDLFVRDSTVGFTELDTTACPCAATDHVWVWDLHLQYRYFFRKTPLNGPFLGGWLMYAGSRAVINEGFVNSFQEFETVTTTYTDRSSYFTGGVVVGWETLVRRFLLDAYVGVGVGGGWKIANAPSSNENLHYYYEDFQGNGGQTAFQQRAFGPGLAFAWGLGIGFGTGRNVVRKADLYPAKPRKAR